MTDRLTITGPSDVLDAIEGQLRDAHAEHATIESRSLSSRGSTITLTTDSPDRILGMAMVKATGVRVEVATVD